MLAGALKEAPENLSYRERRVQIENQSLKKLQQLGEAQKLREVT